MALRTIKNSAESKNKPVFATFEKPTKETAKQGHINTDLNDIMQNMGLPQFTYETFKAAYEADPQLEQLVDNFNDTGVVINAEDDETDSAATDADSDDKTVSQMAKSATDLSDSPLG